MYWQTRFDRTDPNKELEERIAVIHGEHKDFGYRRMQAVLRKEGINVNKKKVQRIMQKLRLQVTSYTRKSRRYNSFIQRFHIKRLLLIPRNLSIMKSMKKDE